jgi:ADP-heptose:LPS heptosyltransferase
MGDIFMHRMMFEDFKRIMPDAEIHFSCPKYYHDAVSDHPFIDKVLDCDHMDKEKYLVVYNTTTACGRAEMKLAPLSGPNRSDIWAAHCGVLLQKHDMHIRMSEEERAVGNRIIDEHRDRSGPVVIFCPVSSMGNKNLSDQQMIGVVNGLRERGCCPIAMHNHPIHVMLQNDVPMITLYKIRHWMSVLHECDYVVSVDTASFHCAGGMKRPMVGIFTFINGGAYGMHYPRVEYVQGPCPAGYMGCYNWGACPVTNKSPKPCLTEITTEMVLKAVDKMLMKWPMAVNSKDQDAANYQASSKS